ncbi:hypothetical protein MPER_01189, partial [Moniliophthora perniciosa FA553]
MPPSVPAWQSALTALSGYNQSLEAPEGVDRGFYIPPPRVLVVPESEAKRAKLVKIPEVVLYQLSVPGIQRLSNKQWRALLDISDGTNKLFNVNSQLGKHHSDMQNLLKELLGGSKMELRWDGLADATVSWKGTTLNQQTVPKTS